LRGNIIGKGKRARVVQSLATFYLLPSA